MTNDSTIEATHLTCGLGGRAKPVQQNGDAQPSEPPAGLMPPSVARELDRTNVLAMRIRKSRNKQHLGHGASIRDLIDEGRR